MGNGGTSDASTPTSTSSLGIGRTAVAISSGLSHTCAILDDGSVSCWGYGAYGQLGNGGTPDASTPTSTSSLGIGRTAVAISSGYYHTCAILDDGSVSCWGNGAYGQLGNGGTSDASTPTSTSSLGIGRTAALSERDFDNDGILNVFESATPSLVTCNPGQFGFYMCVDAPLGKYVPSLGSRYATDCLAGTFQASTGQSSCDDADPGHYVDQPSQSTQTACLAGTYNPSTGSTTSTDCVGADAGHYVDSSLGTGQSTQTACLAGTYNPNTGSTTSTDCISADSGHYVDQPGQSSQTACLAGTYNPNTGSTTSTDCISADSGHYVDQPGQSSQTACLAGTFQASTGQSSCDDADPGYYVDSLLGTAQSTQTACSVGTYNPNTGSTTPTDCVDADVGYYVDQTGQSTQVQCQAGYTTIQVAAPYQLNVFLIMMVMQPWIFMTTTMMMMVF